jgi:hypothetical protein
MLASAAPALREQEVPLPWLSREGSRRERPLPTFWRRLRLVAARQPRRSRRHQNRVRPDCYTGVENGLTELAGGVCDRLIWERHSVERY